MSESYTPRELVNKINEGNNGPAFNPYGTQALRDRLRVKKAEAGDIFAEAEQDIIQEAADIQKAKDAEIQKAHEDLAIFKDYLKDHGYSDEAIHIRSGELEVYFDENTGSAVIARPNRLPFELNLIGPYSGERGIRLTGKLPLPKQLLISALDCSRNQLTELPENLPDSLTALGFYNNLLTQLPNLPAGLTVLECSDNLLTQLTNLPAGLTKLVCSNNLLTQLTNLPAGLTKLSCGDNQLTSLPELPAGLTELSCNSNQLTSLPELPAGLTELSCNDNQLTELPELPAGLTFLYCSKNKLTELPDNLPAWLLWLYCNDNQLTELPELPMELDHLFIDGNPLTPEEIDKIKDQEKTIGFMLNI